jgi:hypothetical protein
VTIQHTAQYALPYPQADDTADVPRDVQALAEATEDAISGVEPAVLRGRLRMSSGAAHQAIPSSNWAGGTITYTQIDFDQVAEDFHGDGDSIADAANNRLVIPKTGLWIITGLQIINNVGASGGYVIHQVRIGASPSAGQLVQAVGNLANYFLSTRVYRCTAGSFVTMWASTNVAGVETIGASGPQGPALEASYLGPNA